MVSLLSRFCMLFSRLIPSSIRKSLADTIRYSGKSINSEILLGGFVLFGIVLVLGTYIGSGFYEYSVDFETDEFGFQSVVGLTIEQQRLITTGIAFVIFLGLFFLLFVYFFFLMEKRSKFVDAILPDALSLIASNMTSGLTPYHAVKSAIREDFGPLAEAFEIATNKSIGTKSFKYSLLEVDETIKSESLTRSMKLFAAAIESGSNVSYLLKSLAQDINERHALKNELITSTTTNSMFIMFMVIVGAPMLMGVSIFFVEMVTAVQARGGGVGADAGAGMGLGGEITITTGFLTIYAYVLLFLTGILVSYFTGVMIEGNGKSGLKKAPFIIGASYVVFIIGSYIINSALGGLI